MEFKKLEEEILKTWGTYAAKHEVDTNETYAVHKLGEEYGEFIQAYLVHKKLCKKKKIKPDDESFADMAAELGDVIGTAMLVAKRLNIDLEKELEDKWIKWAANENQI